MTVTDQSGPAVTLTRPELVKRLCTRCCATGTHSPACPPLQLPVGLPDQRWG